MEGTQVLIARVRRAGMPRPDKIPWSALHLNDAVPLCSTSEKLNAADLITAADHGKKTGKTAVAQQASKEVETSLVSDFSPLYFYYANVFL